MARRQRVLDDAHRRGDQDREALVVIVEGFRFHLFSLEGNEPPHVHVRKGDGKAKLWLSPVELVYARGLTRTEVKRAHELTKEHAAYFLGRWQEYFGR